jgi:Ran GTPase-activating protein (RanGAP) involved in mRNA processing and transport
MTQTESPLENPLEIPLACPVQTTLERPPYPLSELEPLLEGLRANQAQIQQFPKGTLSGQGRLDLCKQDLGVEGCFAVTLALRENSVINSILLGTDAIGDQGAGYVADLLEVNPHIQTVYLGCNHIGAAGVAQLSQAIRLHSGVHSLWLKRNPIGENGAKHLAQLLEQNQTLRVLDLVHTHIGPVGLERILEVLIHHNRTLERLYLGGNQLGPSSAASLSLLLERNPKLKALLLNVNLLGDTGAERLAHGLQHNSTLEELGLASNRIGPRGGIALFGAVKTHPTLKTLDLGYAPSTKVLGASANTLDDSCIPAIADGLRQNTALLSLKLQRNAFSSTGHQTLIRALEPNTTLEEVVLSGKYPALNTLLERNIVQKGGAKMKVPLEVAAIKSVYRDKVIG